METSVTRDLTALQQMNVRELLQRYVGLFGCQAHTRNRLYLLRKIAWRIQAQAERGLSDRALRRAEELADGQWMS